MRFLRWFVYLLLLVLLAGLLYLSSLSESRAKELVSLSLPTSFYASEHNSLAKYLSSPSLRSIISLDNKTLIAVGRTGVILKSTDAGESFKSISSPSKEWLQSIVTLDNTTLIAVGSRGVILKSTDAGESFKPISSPSENELRSIISLDNKTLIAVGDNGVILKSTDAGESFKPITSPNANEDNLYSIVSLDNKTLIAVGDNGVILKSTDAGESFKPITSPNANEDNLYSIVSLDNKTLIAVGDNGVILKSTDAGESFTSISSPSKLWLRSIVSLDNKTLIAVGSTGVILKSTDAGESFTSISSPSKLWLRSIVSLDNKTLIAVGSIGVILKSTDAGESFTSISSPSKLWLRSIISLDNKTLIAVGRSGNILKSTDAGESFKSISSPSKQWLRSIVSLDNKTLIAVVDNGVILKSTDAGESFTSISSPSKQWLRSIVSLDNKTLIAVGSRGVILKSTDAGESFKPISSPSENELRSIISLDNKTLIAVGDNGVILKSTDAGESFKPITSPNANGDNLYSIVSLDNKTLIAVGDNGVILKSTDAGESFKPITSPNANEDNLYSIVSLDNKTLIAVGDNGVILKSTDAGESFNQIKVGQVYERFSYAHKVGDRVYLLGDVSGVSYLDLKSDKIVYPSYYRTMSIWFYGLLVVLGLLVVAGALYGGRALGGRQKLGANASSDKPVASLGEDKYGLKVLVDSLVTLISNPYTTTPLSIAIDAPWGHGKSSLIHMSKRELERLGIRSFVFNAWYHQEEKHMLASLMQGILTHFVPSAFSFEGVLFYMGLFVKRVFLNPVRLLGFVALVLGVYVLWQADLGASGCYAHLPKVVSVVALMAFVLHAMKPYDALTQQFVKSYKTLFGFKKFDESIGLRDEFSQEIRDIINPLGKAVVFIDDLDRCSDEDIFKVMQTVNFLTTVDNLFIVMAVDKQKVVDAIERYYKNSGYVQKEGQSNIADDYIEKIFNITVKIPKVDSQFYKDYKGYEYKYQQDDYKKIMAIRESKLARFMEALFTKYLVAVLAIAWVLFNFGYIKEQVDSGAASLKGLVVQMQKCDSNATQESNSSKGADAPIMPNAKINEINGTKLEAEKEQPSSEVPEIYKDLPVTIDARIKQKKWYQVPMVWLFALLGVGFVMLLIVVVLKKKEQKRADVEKIWDYIHTSISLSPRERNIEFNKINFFTTIGNKYYIENVTMGNVYRQMMKFGLGFVYAMIFFLLIRGERNENLFTRFKNRIVDAFKYAFDIPIEGKKNSVVDDLEMFFKAKYEGKDSRLEVVEFRERML